MSSESSMDILRFYVCERDRRSHPGTLVIDEFGFVTATVKAESAAFTDAVLLCRGVPALALELLTVFWLGERVTPYHNERRAEGVGPESSTWPAQEANDVRAGRKVIELRGRVQRKMTLYDAARVIGITGQRARRLYAEALLTVASNRAARKDAGVTNGD